MSEYKTMFAPGRYLVYSQFKGQPTIHVREYDSNGIKDYPTKKGVCLSPERLNTLRSKMDEIDERLKDRKTFKFHLGEGIYASIDNFHGVDLRRFWIPEGQTEMVPTKRGIYLPATQWNSLKEKINHLLSIYPEIDCTDQMTECRDYFLLS